MPFVLSLLLILTLSIVVTRVATIALVHTGLSIESARFQARSAFTGAGFTTSESEGVVEHPVRRRIVMALMLWGNAGLVTAVSSVILTFVSQGEETLLHRGLLLAAGLGAVLALSKSAWVDRHLSRLISRALRRYTTIDVRDYASLMHLAGDYRLVELKVEPDDWVAGKSLAELQLRDEGIIVLGIRRTGGLYLGAPNGDTFIEPDDVLILYGREPAIEGLDRRIRNITAELRHERAVLAQKRVEAQESRADAAAAAAGALREESGPPPS